MRGAAQQDSRDPNIQRLSNVSVTDIVVHEGEVVGAVGVDVPTCASVKIKCPAVVLCTGGIRPKFPTHDRIQ